MKKIYQTKTGEKGDCFNACLASILEMDIKKLPKTKHHNHTWLKDYKNFLSQFNLSISWCKPEGSNEKIRGYAIGAFERVDKKYTHAIVCFNGRKKHDPFPITEKAAKTGKLVHWYVITILDPSKPFNGTIN